MGRTTFFACDAVGNLFLAIDSLSHSTTFVYDELDRRVGVEDALNQRSTVVYDAVGQVTAVVDALNRRTTVKRQLLVPLVPLPDRAGAIPGGLQDFGDGATGGVQITLITGEVFPLVFHHVTHARLMGVETGQETGASRTTTSTVVELGESHPTGRECVEVRGRDFATVTPRSEKPMSSDMMTMMFGDFGSAAVAVPHRMNAVRERRHRFIGGRSFR